VKQQTEKDNVTAHLNRVEVSEKNERVSTGIVGLDEVLHGGLLPHRAYLVRGGPGCGKTTLGMQFLSQGTATGDSCIFINLGEPEEQIRANAKRIGLDLTGITFIDLSPDPSFFAEVQSYDIFSPAEVEREPMTQRITDQVKSIKPQRVFLDAMTQFRYFSTDAFQFRKQVHSFLRFLVEQGATVLFTSEGSAEEPDNDLQFMSDGVINLDYNNGDRTLEITKFRGSDFIKSPHSMRLTASGMQVYPRLTPGEYTNDFKLESISSGIPEMDEMLSGGLERGTVTIITGPTGVGKTTLGLQFMKEAAGRGERSVIYSFEEWRDTLLQRSEAVNIPIGTMLKRGTLDIVQVEPLRYTPDEFARMVRQEIETNNTSIVMLDSIAGYRLSVRGDKELLTTNLHALSKYLQNMGVAVILINEIERITGEFSATDIGISYLADNIIFLRYLEILGEMRRAIGVLKKRLTDFERTLREIEITRYGIKVGRPLTNLRGILSGIPEFVTPPSSLDNQK
jgi:circadian clock protein KaiC